MVGRQVASGLTVGGLLALLALFLTTPREVVEVALSDWVPAPAPDDRGPLSSGLDDGLGVVGRTSAPDGERPHGRVRIDALVGSRGAGTAVAALEGAPLMEGAPWGARPELQDRQSAAAEAKDPDEFSSSPDQLHPDAFLGTLAKQTVVREAPEHEATVLGYVRAGTLLRRALVPASKKGCRDGWYRVEPRGFVCAGKAATLDLDDPILQLASYAPDRSLGMPYPYGRARYPTPALYSRLPTPAEQLATEIDLETHLAKNFGREWKLDAAAPPPSLIAHGQSLPLLYGQEPRHHDFFLGRALPDTTFSFIDMFEAEGRYFGLTTDFSLVPLDRVTHVETSKFSGVVLSATAGLPVAFVMRSGEQLYGGNPAEGGLRPLRAIARREGFSLSGRQVAVGGALFLETSGGDFLRSHPELRRIEAPEKLPQWAKDSRSWFDVSIGRQTLVAYQGSMPVFATLISSGKDGLGDPETTHSTVLGLYLIHTKHVSATMSGHEADDEFDLRDVPYVQYFHEGYAFHAAYWHDNFGTPRSHGCINLSPADARHLFNWTDPPVPQRWHSALSREGTLVHIHP